MSNDFDVSDFINKVRWQYAKTMPQWPHEYTIKVWRLDLAADFEAYCRLIMSHGVVEPWPSPPERAIYRNSYLVVGDWKYWVMGPHGDQNLPEEMTVINRARLADLAEQSTE